MNFQQLFLIYICKSQKTFLFSYNDQKSFQFIIYFQRVNISHSFLQILTCMVVLVLSQKIFSIIKKIKNCTHVCICSKRFIKQHTAWCINGKERFALNWSSCVISPPSFSALHLNILLFFCICFPQTTYQSAKAFHAYKPPHSCNHYCDISLRRPLLL